MKKKKTRNRFFEKSESWMKLSGLVVRKMNHISDEGRTMGFQTCQISGVIVGLPAILRQHETSSLT